MTILIADDHVLIRKGIVNILKSGIPGADVEEAESVEKILHSVRNKKFDIIIIDVHLTSLNGLEILKQLRQVDQATGVLVVSLHSDDHYAVRAIKNGADGFLSKSCTPDDLIQAVHSIKNGRKYITDEVAGKLASSYGSNKSTFTHETLSDREFDVLRLIASGKQVSQIASDLHLSVPTVSTYRARILNKMGMKNNAELTHYAIVNRLV